MPFPMRVQREWTCAMCQVTTQSETTLNSHLQGRRHRVRCKELKGKNNQPVKTKSSAAQHKKSDKTVQESGDSVAMSGRSKRHKKMQCQPGNVKHVERKQSLWWCTICNRSCNSVHDMECHLNGRKHLAQVEQLKASSWMVRRSCPPKLIIKIHQFPGKVALSNHHQEFRPSIAAVTRKSCPPKSSSRI